MQTMVDKARLGVKQVSFLSSQWLFWIFLLKLFTPARPFPSITSLTVVSQKIEATARWMCLTSWHDAENLSASSFILPFPLPSFYKKALSFFPEKIDTSTYAPPLPFPLLLKLPSLFYNLNVLLLCWTHTFSFNLFHLLHPFPDPWLLLASSWLSLPWLNPSHNWLPHILLISHLMSFCLLPQEFQWIALPSLLERIQWALLSPCVFRPLRILS